MTLTTWLEARMHAGWFEIDARPGQPIRALHRPTVEAQLARSPELRPLLEAGVATTRAVLEGSPAPAWLVERHRRTLENGH